MDVWGFYGQQEEENRKTSPRPSRAARPAQASRSNLLLIKSLIETLLPPPRREGPRKRLRRCRAAADRWREARIDRPLKLNLLGSWFYMVLIQLLNGEHSFPIGGVY